MGKIKEIATPKRVLSLIVLILILIFAFQNMNSVKLKMVFFSLNMPLLVLILVIYALGLFTGWAVKRNDVKKIVNNVQDETRKEIEDLKKQMKD